jgi:hypothetical protein
VFPYPIFQEIKCAFNLETLHEVPGELTKLVANMIRTLQIKEGIAFDPRR